MNYKMYFSFKNMVLFILIILFGSSSYYFISLGVDNIIEHSITYNSKSNSNIKVYLKENSFFNSPYIELNDEDANVPLISSLIDYIDVDINYKLNFDNMVSGEYIYYVNGTLSADKEDNSSGKGYWSQTYALVEPKTGTYDNEVGFEFIENVKVDYQKYNELLKTFKNTYGLSINGQFKLELVVESVSTNEVLKGDVPVRSVASLNIPLTQQTLELSIDKHDEENKNTIVEEIKLNDFTHIMFLIIGSVQALLALMFLYFLFANIRRKYLEQGEYRRELNKILGTYDSIIVNVDKVPNYNGYNVIKVSNFEELIDAHSEVRMPINFVEEKKNLKSRFVLVSDNIVWEYTLENKKKKGKDN